MKKQSNHIRFITREILDKYLRDELSDRDMHDVERLILESDFEEEAMEGLVDIPPDELAADLERLEASVDQRTRPARSFRWWQIAAAVAVLLSAGALFVFFPGPDDRPIALNEQVAKKPGDATSSENEQENAGLSSTNEEEKQASARSGGPALRESGNARRQALLKEMEQEEDVYILENDKMMAEGAEEPYALQLDEISSADEDHPALIRKKPAPTPDTLPVIIPETSSEINHDPKAFLEGKAAGVELTPDMLSRNASGNKLIRGMVLSDAGEPIPGARVTVVGSQEQTLTDIQGRFNLSVPEGQHPALTFSMTGYETEQVSQVPDSLTIVLDEDAAALSEVVVVGYGTEADNASYVEAAPAIGMDSYRDYLESNLRYPEGEERSGRVVLTFTISADGMLDDFEIKKSLGDKYDQEAIRLVRDGPPWEPARRNGRKSKDTVRLKIRFAPK